MIYCVCLINMKGGNQVRILSRPGLYQGLAKYIQDRRIIVSDFQLSIDSVKLIPLN